MMKGQYFSFDAIVASIIFILALMALLSYWHSVRTYLDYQNNGIQRDAIKVSNMLFTPAYYGSGSGSCADMQRLGLAKSWDERVVDSRLLDCAQSQSAADPEEWLKQRLSTPYDVSIVVTYLMDPENPVFIGERDIPGGSSEVVIMRRLATVEDPDGDTRLATIDLIMYH